MARGLDGGGCAARPLHQPGRELRFLLSPDTPASEVAGSRAAVGRRPAVPLQVALLCRKHSHLSLGVGLQAGGPRPRSEGRNRPKPQLLYLQGSWVGLSVSV